jgi:hypothetical protein
MALSVVVAGITGWTGSAVARGVLDAGSAASPCDAGTLLAVRRVPTLVGLTCGLDQILE